VRGKGPMATYLLVGPKAGSNGTIEVEFVDGPREGQRDNLADSPPTIAAAGGTYRRSVRCADDGALRYVFDGGAEAETGGQHRVTDRSRP